MNQDPWGWTDWAVRALTQKDCLKCIIFFQNKLRLVRLNQALDLLNETLKTNDVADSIKSFQFVLEKSLCIKFLNPGFTQTYI